MLLVAHYQLPYHNPPQVTELPGPAESHESSFQRVLGGAFAHIWGRYVGFWFCFFFPFFYSCGDGPVSDSSYYHRPRRRSRARTPGTTVSRRANGVTNQPRIGVFWGGSTQTSNPDSEIPRVSVTIFKYFELICVMCQPVGNPHGRTTPLHFCFPESAAALLAISAAALNAATSLSTAGPTILEGLQNLQHQMGLFASRTDNHFRGLMSLGRQILSYVSRTPRGAYLVF